MQIDSAHPESGLLPVGAIGEILHELCQPLTALECSLELAMLRGSVVEMRSLTSVALDAARRLHVLANQAQAIEALCRQFRSPRVVALADIATAFALEWSAAPVGRKIFVDPAGLGVAFRRIAGSHPLHGRVSTNGKTVRFILDVPPNGIPGEGGSAPADLAPEMSLTCALVEHLGGRATFSLDSAILEFNAH